MANLCWLHGGACSGNTMKGILEKCVSVATARDIFVVSGNRG